MDTRNGNIHLMSEIENNEELKKHCREITDLEHELLKSTDKQERPAALAWERAAEDIKSNKKLIYKKYFMMGYKACKKDNGLD